MRIFLLLMLTCSYFANAESLAGDWYIDLHLMTLNEDGSFYASGVEPIDDQYGTYQTQNNKIYFTYTMYNMLVKASLDGVHFYVLFTTHTSVAPLVGLVFAEQTIYRNKKAVNV